MGFTIDCFSLLGFLPQPFYISIQGSYVVKKNQPTPGAYVISYVVYYSSAKGNPVIYQKDAFTVILALPSPADVYSIIYEDIKKSLDPNYGTDQQTLVFTDDNTSRKRQLD